MGKIFCLLSAILICSAASPAGAQQKYALIVGINKYYDKPGVLHRSQLGGCVNDAMSVKNMLILQFGFKEQNMRTLLDAQATKESLISSFTDILSKAKKGDAVVFYYSGHGSWMSNKSQSGEDEKLKRGMNQAMVMSNLYAPNMDCLVRDAVLKKIGNQFVDKGVVFTVITDCCFSGLIVMPMLIALHNPYHRVEVYSEGGGKFLGFNEIFEPYSAAAKEADSTLTNDRLLNRMDKTMDSSESALRSFNLKDALIIHDSAYIIPPSVRPNSMFLSLSASNDIEPSLEEPDETDTRHGIFTKALLDAVKDHGPGMSVSEMFQSILATFRMQKYSQEPQHHEDPARLNMNLIGTSTEGLTKTYSVPAAGSMGNKVLLHAGEWHGITPGNILVSTPGHPRIMLRVDKAGNDSAEATVLSGNVATVKPGDMFKLVDRYTASAPLLKVFLAGQDITAERFRDLMAKKIMPLTRLQHYMSYEDWYHNNPSWNINYNDPGLNPDKLAEKILKDGNKDSFVLMLPIPEYIAGTIKLGLQKNQNIVFVNTPTEADYTLYLNYVRGKNAHFVFTWNHPMLREYNSTLRLVFINRSVKTKAAVLDPAELPGIITGLSFFCNEFIRETSNHWLNFVPRR